MKPTLFGNTLLFLSITFLTGCTTLWEIFSPDETKIRKGVSSSLVDYLYPNGEIPPKHDESIPNLHLPLRVGLAFVPGNNHSDTVGLTAAHKAELLEKVKAQFRNKEYINDITVIPEIYLKSSSGGFDSVDQIARLYGIDIMALVSYDQVVHLSDAKTSIFYWTIIGAYAVKGSKNDVQTFVDTAIFDVKTHKLLLRAPGIDKIAARSNLIDRARDVRKSREDGFTNAVDDMIINLEKELDLFKERIKQDKSITVTKSSGYSGGGSFGLLSIVCLFLLALTSYSRRRAVR